MNFDERNAMSNTFHVSLDVPDLERAVAFYGGCSGSSLPSGSRATPGSN
jgi:hypothetical protein